MSREWTIDSIAHALSPERRHEFLREINLTPVSGLPAVLERWIRLATARREMSDTVRAAEAHHAAHGVLPPGLEPTDEATAHLDELRAHWRAEQGRGAA
ncbi:hypothetical protein [Streptomyces sp. NPDC003077]|uniref:hypothetical protein n=1 Tax=Streptomyces sp. NPDC003077 TaxID=3154443 RepID=UPI0033AC78C3